MSRAEPSRAAQPPRSPACLVPLSTPAPAVMHTHRTGRRLAPVVCALAPALPTPPAEYAGPPPLPCLAACTRAQRSPASVSLAGKQTGRAAPPLRLSHRHVAQPLRPVKGGASPVSKHLHARTHARTTSRPGPAKRIAAPWPNTAVCGSAESCLEGAHPCWARALPSSPARPSPGRARPCREDGAANESI